MPSSAIPSWTMLGIHAHVHCARGKQARDKKSGRAAEQVAWDYNVLECQGRALRIEHVTCVSVSACSVCLSECKLACMVALVGVRMCEDQGYNN